MFPLGRYIAFGKDDFGNKKLDCGEIKYLLQPIECGDKSETHTVREWLGDFDISLEDTAFVHWNQAMSIISMKLKELEMHSNFSFQIHYIYKKWLIISKNLDLRAYKQDFKLNLLPFYYY